MEAVNLRIDARKMNAYLTISSAAVLPDVTLQDLVDYLKQNGIVVGINEDTIRKMLERNVVDRPIKVALGIEPIRGNDGSVKFYFKTNLELKPKILPDGSVDYKDLNLAQKATKGQVLAERIPPTSGIPGKNLFGEEVPAEIGNAALLMTGQNTEFTDESSNIVVAQEDGSVKLRPGNRVFVDTVFRVEENVDFSTGDLDVNGDIFVSGNVISGFKIKATGNIIVNGIVEDAVVEAGGDVMVRRGFVGSGRGVINAGGKVVLKFVNNQTVNAGDFIDIGEEAFHSTLNAGKYVNMTRGRGTMVGGEVHASDYVELNTVGSELNVRTSINVAENADLGTEAVLIDSELKEIEQKITENMDRIMGLMERKTDGDFTDNQKRVIRSLEESTQHLDKKKNKLENRKKEIEAEVRVLSKDAYVTIKKRVYPKIKIQIGWLKTTNTALRGFTHYKVIDDQIVASSV